LLSTLQGNKYKY